MRLYATSRKVAGVLHLDYALRRQNLRSSHRQCSSRFALSLAALAPSCRDAVQMLVERLACAAVRDARLPGKFTNVYAVTRCSACTGRRDLEWQMDLLDTSTRNSWLRFTHHTKTNFLSHGLHCLATASNSGLSSAPRFTSSQAGGHLTPNSYTSDFSRLSRNQVKVLSWSLTPIRDPRLISIFYCLYFWDFPNQ
jgi:hypothetical protein